MAGALYRCWRQALSSGGGKDQERRLAHGVTSAMTKITRGAGDKQGRHLWASPDQEGVGSCQGALPRRRDPVKRLDSRAGGEPGGHTAHTQRAHS